MGEYECWDCNKMFWLDEPPEGREICDECRKEYKKKSATYYNVMLRDHPEKLEGRK